MPRIIPQERKIRMALIGCGRIAEKHFHSVELYPDEIELVAVCDTDERALAKAVERSGARGFASLRDLLSECEVDLVALCTPSGLHPGQTIRSAMSGCHVMTEKPMATRWKDGLRMVRACDEAGVHLFVVKQNRNNSTLQLLKDTMERKRFGRIYMVQVNVFWSRPQSYYDSAAWRGTWEFDGGALMNQASHYIDLLDWLIGPVQSVQAMTGTLARDIEVEDTAVMNVRWRQGVLGSVAVTMLTYPRNMEGSITILGEKGTVRVGGVAVNEIQHWEFNGAEDGEAARVKLASYETNSVYGFGHPAYYRNVIETLRGREKPYTDGREGLKSLELLIASYLSARDGKEVSLPLEY